MRSIYRIARAAVLALAWLAPLGSTPHAQQSESSIDGPTIRGSVPSSRFDEADEIATLEAIRLALSEVGDGGTYAWYRESGLLNGVVSPTSSFKDRSGRVCRHIVVILSAGPQTGRLEGVACRAADGRWVLEG